MSIEIIATVIATLKGTGFGFYSSCLDVLDVIRRTEKIARLTVCGSITDLDDVVTRSPDFVIFGG